MHMIQIKLVDELIFKVSFLQTIDVFAAAIICSNFKIGLVRYDFNPFKMESIS